MKQKIIAFYVGLFLFNFVFSQNYALRFFGNGEGDIDRVKIPIDNPPKNANVGNDFTIEFQMKATITDNPLGSNASEGENDDWTLGHIIIDRDVFGPGDYGDYGLSLANGKIAFGVNNGTDSYTAISETFVADGNWHHIAVTRNSESGVIQIFIDGILDKSVSTNVTGNISYRNGRDVNWPNEPYIVLCAEKHDYDNSNYPSYNGILDELRISNIIRYSSNYTPLLILPDDDFTMALYHFDEGSGNLLNDQAVISGNGSHGIIKYGGNPYGPLWVLNDMSQNQTVEIMVNIYPPNSGNVTGAGLYQIGEQVILEAIPAENFVFLNWSENNNTISNNPILSFSAENTRIITANFQEAVNSIKVQNDNSIIIANPVHDFIKINFQMKNSFPVYLELFSSSGILQDKFIIQSDCTEFIMDISGLKSGIYFLKLIQNDKIFNYKILKK